MDQKKSCTNPWKPAGQAIGGGDQRRTRAGVAAKKVDWRHPGPEKNTGGDQFSKLNTVTEPIYCQVGSISPNIIYSLDTAAFSKCNS